MTFIKNDDPENSSLSTDLRNIFIGRTNELEFFVREILQPKAPTYNIISIWGNAGVGKSTLLTKFIDIAHGSDFKDYCLTAQVDERQATPASIMEKFAGQLRIAGYPLVDFEKALDTYKAIVRNLRASQDTQQEISLHSNLFEPTSLVFRDLNLHGNPQGRTSPITPSSFEGGYLYRQLFKDFERIEDPIGELTTAFINDLNRLADTTVALSFQHANHHQRRVLLFFDTFEQLALDTVPWLLNYFLEATISSNIILVIAGHKVIERSIQSYQRRWQKHKSTIYPIFLDSFTEGETRNYLTAQGVTEPKRISTLLRLSRGLPYSLSLLTSNSEGEVDLAKDVFDNFLRGIPEQEEMKRQLALEAALLTRPFNRDDLKAFAYLTENDRPILYRWLSEQPFVRSNPQDGRHSYHDLARETFTRHLYQISPVQYQSTRKALADHYQLMLEKIQVEAGKGIYKIPEWLELVIALAHQLFLLPDEASHIKAIEQILEAYQHTSREQDGEVIRFLREISQDEPANMANGDARQIAKFLIQYIETSPKKRVQEFLAATSFLIEKLEKASSKALLARIHRDRGESYSSLKRYQQALADLNRAIEHDSSFIKAYISRAEVYKNLNRYEDALLGLNQALEIESDNELVFINRGLIYERLKRYEEALQDFERVIELELDLKPIASSLKGILLYEVGKYQEAATSLTQAIITEPTLESSWIWLAKAYQAIHPYQEVPGLLKALSVPKEDSASVITNRAIAMKNTGYYEEAIVEATRAIELEPKSIRAIILRGTAYGELHRFEESLNDFSLAHQLKPNDPEVLLFRGQTYNNLKRYTDALHDFSTVLGYKSTDREGASTFFARSQTYWYMKQYKEALRDLDRAIELDRDLEHLVQEQRGQVLQKIDKNEEALTAFLEALKTNSTCSDCWTGLAKVYEKLYSRREIPRLLREVTVVDENSSSVLASRALAMHRMRHEEEAMVELARAIELDSDNGPALDVRSVIYNHWDRYEEALRDLDRLVEVVRSPKHWMWHRRGRVFQYLGRNEEALTAFVEALKTNMTCSGCWTDLAVTYEVLEDRSKTSKWLRELSASNFDESATLTCRAEALRETSHFEEAILTFTEALRLKPNDVKSIISRGQIYHKLKLYEKALTDFTEALKLKPNDADALLSRGRTHSDMNRHREALKDFDLAIKVDSDFEHEGYEEKGLVFYSLQRYQEAITAFSQALKIEPACSKCWTGLVRTYEASFTRSQLPKLVRAVPISTTDKALAIAARAEVMRNLGYYQEALEDLDYALALDKTLISRFIDSRGLLLSYLEHYEEAIGCYKQRLEYSPNHYQVLYNIAVAMARWKGMLDAQKYIDAAREALLAKVPTVDRGSALYGLGGLAALTGVMGQAMDYLKRAIPLEDACTTWAQHDIAWLDLRSDPQFQYVILNGQQENGNSLVLEGKEQQQGFKNDILPLESGKTLITHLPLPQRPLKVFLCYSPDERPAVQELYRRLQADGFDPWLDEENLLPGQEEEAEIRKAVRSSDAVIVCLSHNAIQMAGRINKQIAHALDVADEQPEGTIFLIPLRLENCPIPERLSRWHSVNLYDEQGYVRLIDALRTKFSSFI